MVDFSCLHDVSYPPSVRISFINWIIVSRLWNDQWLWKKNSHSEIQDHYINPYHLLMSWSRHALFAAENVWPLCCTILPKCLSICLRNKFVWLLSEKSERKVLFFSSLILQMCFQLHQRSSWPFLMLDPLDFLWSSESLSVFSQFSIIDQAKSMHPSSCSSPGGVGVTPEKVCNLLKTLNPRESLPCPPSHLQQPGSLPLEKTVGMGRSHTLQRFHLVQLDWVTVCSLGWWLSHWECPWSSMACCCPQATHQRGWNGYLILCQSHNTVRHVNSVIHSSPYSHSSQNFNGLQHVLAPSSVSSGPSYTTKAWS